MTVTLQTASGPGGVLVLAVPTPGHTQGHVVFADVERALLFAGDHVLPRITPSVGFEAAFAKQPLGDYLRSLRLMLQMPDMRLLPAHGAVTESTHARVEQLLAHHEDRLAACLARVIFGAGTAYDTARALPWTRRAGEPIAEGRGPGQLPADRTRQMTVDPQWDRR